MSRDAYADTSVPVSRTQEAIRTLLLRYHAAGVQFAEDWDRNQFGFVFGIKRGGVPLTVRMLIDVWPAGTPSGVMRAARRCAQRERQVWRALYHYLKAQLEAIAFGLRTFESTFLADIVLRDGRVMGDQIREWLTEGKIILQLPAPEIRT